MQNGSSLNSFLYEFMAIVLVLAVLAPWLINFVTNGFVFLLVDHIQGTVVGAFLGAFLGPNADKQVEVGIGDSVFTISASAIGCAILQSLLFH